MLKIVNKKFITIAIMAQARMIASLDGAFQSGSQPSQSRNLAIVLRTPNRKRHTLVTKEGQPTDAGRYWYEQLHQVAAPTIYRYEQPLIDDRYVETWDGRRIAVRSKNSDNTWTITAAGRNYFKYNRSEFIVDIPYVISKESEIIGETRIYKIKHPVTRRDRDTWYKPLFDEDAVPGNVRMSLTVGSVRQAARGAIRPRNLEASPDQQKQEVIESVRAILNEKPRVMGEGGVMYTFLLRESQVDFLWDEARDFKVHEQRINFYDDRPPSTETILARPLRSFAIPDGTYRSWDLHPDSFKTFEHGCVVQMLYKSLTKRPGGNSRKAGNCSRVPMFSIEQIQSKLDAIFTQLGYEEGKAPFDEGGWRDVGATAEMIIKLCQEIKVNCYVHHRRELLTYIAPESKPGMAIVNVSIWGDHVYFYAGDSVGRCEMNRVASRQASDKPQLEYGKLQKDKPLRDHYSSCVIEDPFRHEKTPPFDQWRTEGDLYHAIEEAFDNIREEFSGKKRKWKNEKRNEDEGLLFWSTDIHDVYGKLQELQDLHAGTDKSLDVRKKYGSDMHSICGLHITGRGIPKIKVKGVPEICHQLHFMSVFITKHLNMNQKSFIYRGESLSAWTENLRLLVCKVDREPRTKDEVDKILTKYDHRCAQCDDKLATYDLDHIQPLCDGGSDEMDNMQPLCLPCHAEKCSSERRSIYGKTMYSELNIDVQEGLWDAPKPRQLYFGDNTQNCLELDISKCRRRALERSVNEFPEACILDTIQKYVGQPHWEFAYVDAGPPDTTDFQHYCFYSGPRWYHRELFFSGKYLNTRNAKGEVIDYTHIKCIFKASQTWPANTIALIYKEMQALMTAALDEYNWLERERATLNEKFIKEAILAMQGSWLTQHKYAYDITESTHSSDVSKKIHSFQTLSSKMTQEEYEASIIHGTCNQRIENGVTRFASRTEILTNRTMYLIGLQALNTEHKYMGWAVYQTRTLPAQIQIKGAIVDCLLLKCKSKADEEIVKQFFASWTPEGVPFARVKSVKDSTHIKLKEHEVQKRHSSWVPYYCQQDNEDEDKEDEQQQRFDSDTYGNWYFTARFKYERVWREIVEEPGIGTCDENDTWQEQVANEIVKNRGAIVTGCGGCGKSKILELVKKKFEDFGYKVEPCAFTHVASANVDGDTILRQLHSNSQAKRRVFLVDEGSMVSIRLWAALQTLQFTGNVFVVFGDWAGQLPPIPDRESLEIWRTLPRSDFMHQLVNGLSIQINKYRRGKDYGHYMFVKSLYPHDSKEELGSALRQARVRYPAKTFDLTGTTLCLTNKCRVAVNEYVNKRLAPTDHVMIKPTGNFKRAAKTPQNMRIWPGIVLMGAATDKDNVKNSTRYKVLEISSSSVKVDQINDKDEEFGKPFELTHEAVGEKLLLSHAITYDSSQARTIYGPLRLLQTDHKMMTLRRLIVGLGRAPEGCFVQID
jgi:hypothetical protein